MARPAQASGSHLVAELFTLTTDTKMTHIPYKGSSPAMADLIGGQIQWTFGTILAVAPHAKSGRLRGLAVSSRQRSGVLPEVPTVAEAGVAGYDATSWNGVLVPAGVPRPIVAWIHTSVARALRSEDVRERLKSDGAEPVGSTPSEFALFIRAEIAKWGKVIKAAKITAE
ncbi:MAG: tripartite tricarboxylate transporter substrate-binding protein [Burkholderiales bacterium]